MTGATGVPIWIVAETNADGTLAKSAAELATLARSLAGAGAAAGSGAGAESGLATGVVVGVDPQDAATELARYLPRVVSIAEPALHDRPWGQVAAARFAEIVRDLPAGLVLVGAGPDGRDVAGTILPLLDGAVLVNATAVGWDPEAGPTIEMSVFGGKLITTSGFVADTWRVVTVRPNVVTAEPASAAGEVEARAAHGEPRVASVRVVDRVVESAAAVSIEDARIIVSGGRGVGGEEGFALVRQLAEALGGAVGATRAAVDAGWIPYAQQIGQTGKIVKPQLYLALGISGAIQHKVGMQAAGTIVAVNRDPDAPIAEFADVLVVGDLFEVGRALLSELEARD